MQKQIKLIHISDIHMALDHMTVKDMIRAEGLLSKRILGWINFRWRRKDQFSQAARDRVRNYLIQNDWDFLAVTGDLTYLSLDEEFQKAREWLEPFISKGTALLTAGNHDRYVPSAAKPDLMKKYFADCFPFDKQTNKNGGINCLELSENAVLFEIDMSVPRKLFSSRGRIKSDLDAYRKLIQEKYTDHFKIAIGHYPVILPENRKDIFLHRLSGRKKLSRFFADCHIDLYLHGHIHQTWRTTDKSRPTIHINSGGCFKSLKAPYAGFHEITLKHKTLNIQKIIL